MVTKINLGCPKQRKSCFSYPKYPRNILETILHAGLDEILKVKNPFSQSAAGYSVRSGLQHLTCNYNIFRHFPKSMVFELLYGIFFF